MSLYEIEETSETRALRRWLRWHWVGVVVLVGITVGTWGLIGVLVWKLLVE